MNVKVRVKCMGEWMGSEQGGEYEIHIKDNLEGLELDHAIFDAIYNSIDFEIVNSKQNNSFK